MPDEHPLRLDLPQDLTESAEEIFARYGLTPSEAIEHFYRQVVFRGHIPFRLTGSGEVKETATNSSPIDDDLAALHSFFELSRDLGLLDNRPVGSDDQGDPSNSPPQPSDRIE